MNFIEENEKEVLAGLYVRVSSPRQVKEGVSLEKQEDDLRAYIDFIKRTRKAKVVEVYREEGYSARTGSIKKRKEFQRMLKDVETGKINTLVIYKLDRFCRSNKDLADTLEILEKYKINFESLQDKIDTRTANGRLIINILSSLAQHESEQISERTTGAMEYVAKLGKSNGGKVLGYKRGKDGFLEPVLEEVKLVKMMFKKCVELGSGGAVLSFLNKNGYRRPIYQTKEGKERGGGPFNKMAVLSILQNKKYIGLIQHNEKTFEGKHKPIISNELFDEVQETLDSNRKADRNVKLSDRIYLLKGLFFCGKCGSHLTPKPSIGRNQTYYPYYVCTKKNHQNGGCKTKSIPAEAVENLVLDVVKKIECDKEEIKKISTDARKHVSSVYTDLKKDYKMVTDRLKKVNEELKKLVDLLKTEGSSIFASIKEEMGNLEEEKENLTDREREMRFQKMGIEKKIESADAIAKSLTNLKMMIEDPNINRKQLLEILRCFILKIEWHQDDEDSSKGQIHTTFYDDVESSLSSRLDQDPHNSEFTTLNRGVRLSSPSMTPRATFQVSHFPR